MDHHLLMFFERRVVAFQDTTGIPKWKLIRVFTLFYLFCFVSQNLFRGRFSLFLFDLLIGIALLFNWWNRPCKKEQEKADRTQMIVPNIVSNFFVFKLIRVIFVGTGVVVWGLSIYLGTLFLTLNIMFYLDAIHTYPITGPTFKERLKNLFSNKKLATNEG